MSIAKPAIYAGSLAFSTGLLSFLLVIAIGPAIASGEQLEAMGMSVPFSMPILLLLGALAGTSYRWFRSANTALGSTAIYLTALLLATTLGMSAIYLVTF